MTIRNWIDLLRAAAQRQEGQTMLVALADSTNFNERSDYAVGLVFVGRTKEALLWANRAAQRVRMYSCTRADCAPDPPRIVTSAPKTSCSVTPRVAKR